MTRDASPFSLIGRREFMQLCAGSLALAASGCRRRDASKALRPATVIMAIPRMRDILPDEVELDFLPFSRLADRDEHGEYVPRLAERWDRSADNLEWTYHLRRDVRWHDGRTADPVQRDEIHSAMTRIFQADVPVTFLLPEVWTAFAHRRIQGLNSPWRADPVMFMEELWVEEDVSRSDLPHDSIGRCCWRAPFYCPGSGAAGTRSEDQQRSRSRIPPTSECSDRIGRCRQSSSSSCRSSR